MAALGTLATLGCGQPQTPAEVVTAYFRALGRDPARSLPLLSPAFHRHHGLRMARFEGWLWGWPSPSAGASESAARASEPGGVESAAFAWLYVQTHPSFPALASTLRLSDVELLESDQQAHVGVRVRGRGGQEFVQRFTLSRAAPRSSWRIDRIDQIDVSPSAHTIAFVAFPHDALIDALLRAGGVRRP